MSIFKYTQFFREFQFSWSESWIFSAPTDLPSVAALQAYPLRAKRQALLGENANMWGDRVALLVNSLGQPVTRRAVPKQFYFPGVTGLPCVPIRTSLLVQFSTADEAHNKLLYMGGVPRALNPFDDTFLNTGAPAWQTAFGSWVDQLITSKMGWYSQSLAGEDVIIDYAFDVVTGQCTYTLKNGGINWPALDKVTKVSVDFPGVRSALDGVQDVIPRIQSECTTVRPRPAGAFTNKGVMKRYELQPKYLSDAAGTVPNGKANILKFVGHQRGNSLGASRGRRRATVRF